MNDFIYILSHHTFDWNEPIAVFGSELAAQQYAEHHFGVPEWTTLNGLSNQVSRWDKKDAPEDTTAEEGYIIYKLPRVSA